MTITLEQLLEVSEWLVGTCNSVSGAIDYFDLDIDENDLEDELLSVNTEMCLGCGWWHESGELAGEDDTYVGYCEQCRPIDGEIDE